MAEPRTTTVEGSRPNPDPTELTRDAVNEAIERSREYVDGRIAVLEERLHGIDRATTLLNEQMTRVPTDVQKEILSVREVVGGRFDALNGILEEQRRAKHVEEQEREKAAKALRIELSRAIEEGDRNLRDHIAAQVAQINAALESAELLEVERMGRMTDQIVAERRVTELTRQLSDLAISKAEDAHTKQFDEFSKSQKEQMADLRTSIEGITRRMDKTLT